MAKNIGLFYSLRFAEKNGLPLLEYCTLPRTGALEIIMQVIGPALTTQNEEIKKESNRAQIIVTHSVTVSNGGKSTSTSNAESNEPNEIYSVKSSNSNSQATKDDIQDDTREIVTNNNQIKWNAERYFR